MMRLAQVAFLLSMVLGPSACPAQKAPLVDKRIPVGWSFKPDSAERTVVQSMLRTLLASRPGRDSFIDGQVYRFGGEGADRRYLLERSESEESGEPVITLYVLESTSGREMVSAPFGTSIVDHPGWFEPLQIADLDGDSAPDFAFCAWRSGEEKAALRAVGYKQGWYEIPLADSAAKPCPVP